MNRYPNIGRHRREPLIKQLASFVGTTILGPFRHPESTSTEIQWTVTEVPERKFTTFVDGTPALGEELRTVEEHGADEHIDVTTTVVPVQRTEQTGVESAHPDSQRAPHVANASSSRHVAEGPHPNSRFQ